MAEELKIVGNTKEEKYQTLLSQINALIEGEGNSMANLANVSAALKETFNWLWIGFYLVDTTDELVLGPFQGPIACTRIKKGKGVCGGAWEQEKTLVVDDVEAFPGHIACSSASRSEIVVPIISENKVLGVLDADSSELSSFDLIDKKYLEKLCATLSTRL
ncbi:MAG: GAF domain-containing protein [Lishizhenia sp.]